MKLYTEEQVREVLSNMLLTTEQVESILKELSPQDPAICNYSGLRPVEEFQEEIDKEIVRIIIADLDTEEGKEKAECFRRGWLAGYDKGLYDGQNKEDIDKEMKIDKGDINFMYKWIRSKSGK